MRLTTTLLAILTAKLLAACSSYTLPVPQTQPRLVEDVQWFKWERYNKGQESVQTGILAAEQLEDGIRFVQTDILGAPVSRQTINSRGWQNDGFIMPNMSSRLLFAALLPLITAENAAPLYPESKRTDADTSFCSKGALFRYRNRDIWCVNHTGRQFLITLPDQTSWSVTPIEPL